ncbi:ribosomal protein S12 methylthiotransferase accessory factor [Paenibacillus sp. DS2015]|uniref:YcaO-like family protein n=1 Tax=Paenibacillus sp. DS2015 TaxID=3373917 RepID=UPI003D204C84
MKTLEELCGIGKLMSVPQRVLHSHGDPKFPTFSSMLGDLNAITLLSGNNFGKKMEVTGAGGDVDDEMARTKCIAETLERYCSCVYDERQFILASPLELGNEALDLQNIPMCSELELEHPRCPIRRPPLYNEKIRWVRGVSLTTNRLVWIPSIMVYLFIPYQSDAERFWLPISTGCASHVSYEKALINGILEVIERDAIALTWLHQLPLPKLQFNGNITEEVHRYSQKNEQFFYANNYYFNATTDLGIPTIYAVQRTKHNKQLANMVMCTTELNPEIALTKIMREGASCRAALQNNQPPAKEVDEFINVIDGATYMGLPENSQAFDFLVESVEMQEYSSMKNLETGSDKLDLQFLIKHLESLGHEIFAVDLSTDESERAGMKAVRVIIPTLQPLSFSHRARFLGTNRLYKAVEKMGYGLRTEAQITTYPQPFA